MAIQNTDWPAGWVVYCPDNLPFIRVWGKEANTYSPQYEDCPLPVFYDSGKPGPVVFRSRKMAEQHAKKIAQGFPKWNKSAEVIHTKDLVNLMPSPPERDWSRLARLMEQHYERRPAVSRELLKMHEKEPNTNYKYVMPWQVSQNPDWQAVEPQQLTDPDSWSIKTDPPVTLEWEDINKEPVFYFNAFDRHAHNVMKALEEQYNKRLSATAEEFFYNTEPVGKPDA